LEFVFAGVVKEIPSACGGPSTVCWNIYWSSHMVTELTR